MCDYCDCRDVAPIRELSDEHERMGVIAERLRDSLHAGRVADAGVALAELQQALGPHLEREEQGILAQLAGRDGFAWYLGQLLADHASARAHLLGVTPGAEGWQDLVLSGLDALAEHIGVEEYDLFPASRLIIDDVGWDQVMAVHDRLRAKSSTGCSGQ